MAWHASLPPHAAGRGRRSWRAVVAAVLLLLVASACGRRPPVRDGAAPAGGRGGPAATANAPGGGEAARVYQEMGLLAEGGALPFVGSVSYLATGNPDSTYALVTIAIANRALSFRRDGEGYRADYGVELTVRAGDAVLRRVDTRETVRVGPFRETARSDESILFEQLLVLAPGARQVAVTVRDEANGRAATASRTIEVPRYAGPALSTPIPFYEAALRQRLDSVPRLVPSPRATVVFGRDSAVAVYVEGYGGPEAGPLLVRAQATGEGALVLWRDSVALERRGTLHAGVLRVPTAPLGIGVVRLELTRADGGGASTAPLFIAFGDDLPVASFDQMLSYLRYYTTDERLKTLRDAPVADRGRVWRQFVAGTDPQPETPEHEGLRDYFQRIQLANVRFRDEGGTQGWLTERGKVFVTLGEPDAIREPNALDINQRGRVQIWDYTNRRLQLYFVDNAGFGRWRLTSSSEADFNAVARAVRSRTTDR